MHEFELPLEVVHYGYALPENQMRAKHERNLKRLLKNIDSEPDNAYLYFQVRISFFEMYEFTQARLYLEKGLLCLNNSGEQASYFPKLLIMLAKVYIVENRVDDAISLMNQYAGLKVNHTARYVFAQAGLFYIKEEYMKSLLLYIKASSMNDIDMLGTDLKVCYGRIVSLAKQLGYHDMERLFTPKYEEICNRQI